MIRTEEDPDTTATANAAAAAAGNDALHRPKQKVTKRLVKEVAVNRSRLATNCIELNSTVFNCIE